MERVSPSGPSWADEVEEEEDNLHVMAPFPPDIAAGPVPSGAVAPAPSNSAAAAPQSLALPPPNLAQLSPSPSPTYGDAPPSPPHPHIKRPTITPPIQAASLAEEKEEEELLDWGRCGDSEDIEAYPGTVDDEDNAPSLQRRICSPGVPGSPSALDRARPQHLRPPKRDPVNRLTLGGFMPPPAWNPLLGQPRLRAPNGVPPPKLRSVLVVPIGRLSAAGSLERAL